MGWTFLIIAGGITFALNTVNINPNLWYWVYFAMAMTVFSLALEALESVDKHGELTIQAKFNVILQCITGFGLLGWIVLI